MTIELATLDELNRCKVEQMVKLGSSLDPSREDSCRLFGKHVKQVEAALIYTYGIVAHLAVHKASPADAAELWKSMVQFCDLAITALRTSKDQFAYCGTPELYDLALDYRISAEERYQENLRDSECLSLEIPPGLFPKQNLKS